MPLKSSPVIKVDANLQKRCAPIAEKIGSSILHLEESISILSKTKDAFCNPDFDVRRERRCFPAGANPVRQLSLQPVAIGAVRGGNETD